jgi:7-cyano-7-deazaguanine tRNA-ribosyltransferase
MFALAAATGCDLFDSAAYALYARDDRYLTVRGTEQLDDLAYLPCSCPVCATRDPDDLRALADDDRERRLAEHNLHVSFAELRRVKQAIRAGSLLELVEARARGHPALLDGYRTLLSYADDLETHDPASKGTFFHLSADSARRPEVRRHHERLDRLDVRRTGEPDDGSVGPDADDPFELLCTEGGYPTEGFDAVWRLVPPFGPVPRALSETYPLTAEVPERRDRQTAEAAARGVARLAAANPDVRITVAHDDWPETALAILPDDVDAVRVPTGDDHDRDSPVDAGSE